TADFVISMGGQSAPATALFSSEDGTILGWNPQLSQRFGVLAADQSATGAVYKGLAMGSAGGANYLYATNFHSGSIDVFDKRFASGTAAGGTLTALNSPFGMTSAPAGFGDFGGALLVGNFGDSHVSAFNLATGRFLGQLQDAHGQPLILNGGFKGPDSKGLW